MSKPKDTKTKRKAVRKRTRKVVRKPKRKTAHRLTSIPQPSESSQPQIVIVECAGCGSDNKPPTPAGQNCWNCSHSIEDAPQHTEEIELTQKCRACRGELKAGEEIVVCPSCREAGHEDHLFSLVRRMGGCPSCGKFIRPAEFIPVVW